MLHHRRTCRDYCRSSRCAPPLEQALQIQQELARCAPLQEQVPLQELVR